MDTFATDLWLELDALFADPKRIAPMTGALAKKLRTYEFDVVCGAMLGGAFLAQLLAQTLNAEFWFTERRAAFSYELPRAFCPRGRRVAIVDDVMSAGSAMRGTYRGARAAAVQFVERFELSVVRVGRNT